MNNTPPEVLEKCNTNNNGFFDRCADDRAAAMDQATNYGERGDFFDLSPEDRAAAYDRD